MRFRQKSLNHRHPLMGTFTVGSVLQDLGFNFCDGIEQEV